MLVVVVVRVAPPRPPPPTRAGGRLVEAPRRARSGMPVVTFQGRVRALTPRRLHDSGVAGSRGLQISDSRCESSCHARGACMIAFAAHL